ncbi:MAG TPA: aspartate carbamoyltransferase catalytic subunit [Syntrophorhabdus sp.]|jgi:aspartate carbamoyltransferase catalytic subunit|nr:aspartate carbamoyltransferase catalytic subunit [Syntrophorhabdus sp.]OPX95005.1 MAG: Aspartate carbamoyltransferase [Syntrophorhabdus sp. PtaB.Bin027]OQB77437.1 MAG: Aspartate carbamoyltransferase [Deltaproteobacteria bacterium ADurb.Bin135]NMC95642.1 aspartate carbamoyltransferase catalytic subunit [Syntrophorhabdus sp.]HNQ46124.1 aspartate carbamoyltransferase catalytic subunit [Syntrophorhabdus sp.]
MNWTKKDLLGITELSKEEILFVLDTAESFKEISQRDIKKVPTLRGKTVITLFYEPSTRTRTSFEIAAKRLSADTINISASTSSYVKGETLKDTAKNLEAMNPDVTIIRHSMPGAPHMLARILDSSVVNGGDGAHEHPTQALLDAYTIREKKGTIDGLKIVIVGDIIHSRVARSNIFTLRNFDSEIVCCGPPTMLPPHMEELGIKVEYNLKKAIHNADVIMMLRIQKERGGVSYIPSVKEYSAFFGLTGEHIMNAKKDVIIMHPGPMNRGVEIMDDVADGPYSVILEQVENGVAVRMAILYLLLGREK